MKKSTLVFAVLGMFLVSCEPEPTSQPETQSVKPTAFIGTIPHSSELPDPNYDPDAPEKAGSWRNVIVDGFNAGSNIDSKWVRTGGPERQRGELGRPDYNSDVTYYVDYGPRLARLDNKDCLRLPAWKSGNNFLSSHVKSKTQFYPKNNEDIWMGARIKLIARDGNGYKGFNDTYGVWPAFWTVNEESWPTKGEIDIMEGYSYGGYSIFSKNLFYGTQPLQNDLNNRLAREYDVNEGWHTYSALWRNRNGAVDLHIYLDGKWLGGYYSGSDGSLNLEAFKDHNVILNVNVGSKDSFGIFNNSLNNVFSNANMFVDWVSVRRRSNN